MMDRQHIQLIVYDFDGVMTDNTVYMDSNGGESVRDSRADGLAVEMLKERYQQLILSSEKNNVVEMRAKKLGIGCLKGVERKLDTLNFYILEHRIALDEVLYVGNDINDLDVMREVGFAVCPADASHEFRSIAGYTTKARGGHGVIRELLDFVGEC